MGSVHVGRGIFIILIGLIIAALAGSFIGGRLGAQEILVIFGLFMLWAVGVSVFRGFIRLRNRMTPPLRPDDE